MRQLRDLTGDGMLGRNYFGGGYKIGHSKKNRVLAILELAGIVLIGFVIIGGVLYVKVATQALQTLIAGIK